MEALSSPGAENKKGARACTNRHKNGRLASSETPAKGCVGGEKEFPVNLATP